MLLLNWKICLARLVFFTVSVKKLKTWPRIFATAATPLVSHLNGHVYIDAPLAGINKPLFLHAI